MEVIDRWFEKTGIAVPASRTDTTAVWSTSTPTRIPLPLGEYEVNVPGIYDAEVKLASCNIDSGYRHRGQPGLLEHRRQQLGCACRRNELQLHQCRRRRPVASLNAAAVVVERDLLTRQRAAFQHGNSSSSITESSSSAVTG